MTGMSSREIKAAAPADAVILEKPFRPEQLLM
jgi:hypothetical protein